MNWLTLATKVQKDYGGEVNFKEEWFICPYCGEPILADDYTHIDLAYGECPICGEPI
jgi:rubrerythrin